MEKKKGLSGLFSPDNKIMQFFMLLTDLLILQFLVVLCSLPIITIGTSFTAMFSVVRKIRKDSFEPVIRTFFTSFKENLKNSTKIWLGLFFAGLVLYVDISWLQTRGSLFTYAALTFSYFLMFLLYLVLIYVFPLQAMFENTAAEQTKNALRIAASHIPTSILLTLLYLVLAFVMTYMTDIFLMFGISGGAYLSSFLYFRVFEKYIPAEPEEEAEQEIEFDQGGLI